MWCASSFVVTVGVFLFHAEWGVRHQVSFQWNLGNFQALGGVDAVETRGGFPDEQGASGRNSSDRPGDRSVRTLEEKMFVRYRYHMTQKAS